MISSLLRDRNLWSRKLFAYGRETTAVIYGNWETTEAGTDPCILSSNWQILDKLCWVVLTHHVIIIWELRIILLDNSLVLTSNKMYFNFFLWICRWRYLCLFITKVEVEVIPMTYRYQNILKWIPQTMLKSLKGCVRYEFLDLKSISLASSNSASSLMLSRNNSLTKETGGCLKIWDWSPCQNPVLRFADCGKFCG